MVQQTTDSKFSQYGLLNSETGLPNHDKQQLVLVAAKKTALRELQNENRIMVPRSLGSSQFHKESSTTVAENKVSGIKRSAPECLVSPQLQQSPTSYAASGHLVYVRRKAEAEVGKNSNCDSTSNSSDYPPLRKLVDEDDTTQQKSQTKEAKNCGMEGASNLRVSSMAFSARKPSVTPSLGKSGDILSPEDSSYHPTSSVIPPFAYPKKISNQHWEERYCQLQNFLKNLDQSNQDDYIRMLQSLSSVELSTHAVELEKRSIQLSLEEAKEIQRVRLLDVLGKYPKIAKASSTHQDKA